MAQQTVFKSVGVKLPTPVHDALKIWCVRNKTSIKEAVAEMIRKGIAK